MRKAFESNSKEDILLVDAKNAFNNLNRKAALFNIEQLCPPFDRYLRKTYEKPVKLVIPSDKRLYTQM